MYYADLAVFSSSSNKKPKGGKPAKQPVAHEPVQYSAIQQHYTDLAVFSSSSSNNKKTHEPVQYRLQHSQQEQQHYADIDHSASSGRRGVPKKITVLLSIGK